MTSARFINIRVNSTEQFKESVSEPSPNTKLYLTYGKVTAWANEAEPDTANSSVATEYEIWKNMIGGKKILGSDIVHVIPRYNWASNSVYIAYDHLSSTLLDGNTPFYVVTKDFNVYKCLANGNGQPSTVEPISVNPGNLVKTPDGYTWKYMYTVSEADQLRFTTDSYIPVRVVTENDGSNQFKVRDQTIDGAIFNVIVTDPGTGYSNTNNVVVSITGDGVSASATANLDTMAGIVSSIDMIDYGANYTYATITITGGGGTGAKARAIITPPGGHGYNPLYELGGYNLMINPRLIGSEESNIPVGNDFRQIAILKDPIMTGTTNVGSNIHFTQATTLITRGVGNYVKDELVYQGASATDSSFSGRVVSWDSANGKLLVINTTGTPTAQSLIGANSFVARFVSSVIPRDMKDHSGQILYVNNIKSVTRSSDQIEDFKIVLKF